MPAVSSSAALRRELRRFAHSLEDGWYYSEMDNILGDDVQLPDGWKGYYGPAGIERLLADGIRLEGPGLDSRIAKFLEHHIDSSASSPRWSTIPRDVKSASALADDFLLLINAMMAPPFYRTQEQRAAAKFSFPYPKACGINILGVTLATYNQNVINLDNPGEAFTMLPILVIRDVDLCSEIDCVIGLRAQEIFVAQATRRFVRGLVLTEKHAYFYHFDRAGGVCFDPIDIHNQRALFVKVILAATSMDRRLVGLDGDIGFTDRGSRYIDLPSPTLVQVNEDGVVETLPGPRSTYIARQPFSQAVFHKKHLRGTGPVGWKVVDQQGRRRFIKDVWLRADHAQEYEFLVAARGQKGVGQLYAYQELEELWDIRGCTAEPRPPNSIRTRLVLQQYGGIISEAKSQLHLLHAFRDAVAGHRNLLLNSNILHRDVSINNVLLGDENDVGNRGVIVDFDLGARGDAVYEDSYLTQVGTPAFMSLKLLQYGVEEHVHCHWDDLESFFYVICWVIYEKSPSSTFLDAWDRGGAKAVAAKHDLLRADMPAIPATFSEAFYVMLDHLQLVFMKQFVEPVRAPKSRPDTDADIWRDYQEVLDIIDMATDKFLAEQAANATQVRPALRLEIPAPLVVARAGATAPVPSDTTSVDTEKTRVGKSTTSGDISDVFSPATTAAASPLVNPPHTTTPTSPNTPLLLTKYVRKPELEKKTANKGDPNYTSPTAANATAALLAAVMTGGCGFLQKPVASAKSESKARSTLGVPAIAAPSMVKRKRDVEKELNVGCETGARAEKKVHVECSEPRSDDRPSSRTDKVGDLGDKQPI